MQRDVQDTGPEVQTQDSDPGVLLLFALVTPSPVHPQMPFRVCEPTPSPASGFTPILSEERSCPGPRPGL